MSELYKNLLKKPVNENMGGYSNRILIYPAHLVSTVPLLSDAPAALADLATATGTFVFAVVANKPIAIKASRNSVGYKAENQGEIDGYSFKGTGTFFYPGEEVEAAAMSRLLNNTEAYVVLEKANGEQRLIGQPGYPCSIKASFEGGTAPADRKGTTFTFENDSFVPHIKLATPIDFDTYFVED
ncbi:MAG: hypothetical protein BGN96_04940 [Bacteroidales bacterium 45-6]|nr:MAG: hypothetical protein BGN96_04940 [Bacteroidales bacterium 45-6]